MRCFSKGLMAGFLVALALVTPAWGFETPKLIRTAGKVEVLAPGPGRWKPASEGQRFEPGSRIRTGPDSEAEIAWDKAFDVVIRLGGGSRLDFLVAQTYPSAFLERGSLMMICEPERIRNFFKLGTKDLRVRIDRGGLEMTVTSNATRLRVFGERMRTSFLDKRPPRWVGEGFKLFARRHASEAVRMDYDDYKEWLVWVPRLYERKDDFNADQAEKEIAR